MNFEIWYPVKPYTLIQDFGASPDYYAKFHDVYGNPEKGHMGIDLKAYHGQKVYAAHDGYAQFGRDEHGGEGIYITTGDFYDYDNQQVNFRTIYWHLIGDTDSNYPSPIPTDGSVMKVKCGDHIGYADNTGAPYESSGDHLHLGLVATNKFGQAINQNNGFNGCIDPKPYFNHYYAEDEDKVLSLYEKIISTLQDFITSFKK